MVRMSSELSVSSPGKKGVKWLQKKLALDMHMLLISELLLAK